MYIYACNNTYWEKNEAMTLKESREEYVGEFGGRKGKGEV